MAQASVDAADPLRALAEEARSGDPGAVRRLLDAVAPSMLAVVRAILGGGDRDTEDVLQESLVGIVQALGTYRGDASFLHFARTIALRRSLDQRRRRARRASEILTRDDEEPHAGVLSETRSPVADALAARRREAFRTLLSELRPEQAETFALRVLFGYSAPEIAARTAAPLDTVKSRLRLAKTALRSRIQDDPILLELSETDDEDAP